MSTLDRHWTRAPLSEELRAKIRARMMGNTHLLGHVHSAITKAKISETLKNGHHRMSEANKAKLIEVNRTRVWTEEARAGVRAARLGQPAHNRGKRMSDEQKAKLIGRKRSPAFCEAIRVRMKGNPGPMLGKRHSPETKEKIRQKATGRIESIEQRKKIGDAHRGEKSTLWRGGASRQPYGPGFTESLRRTIRKRDDYLCQMPKCYFPENGKHHQVHHIDYDPRNHRPVNLILLCETHHRKTTIGDRSYFTEFFQAIQETRGLCK